MGTGFTKKNSIYPAVSLSSLLFVLGCLFTPQQSSAQDLHFSQWFNSPLTTNPANTGFIPDADYRIGANYRNQWSAVMTVPYKTFSVWGDAQVFRNQIESGWLGLGGVILRDAAGSGKLTSTKAYASIAYHQMIGEAHLLSLGFNVGWVNKRINITDLKFPDQFDGKFFDSNIPTSVVIDAPNVNYLDMQVGLNYAYFPTDNIYFNGGLSVWHLNRPRETFFTTDPVGFDNRISPRYNAFGHLSIKLNEDVIINPMAYFSMQAKSTEFVAGGNIQYNLSGDGDQQLIGGIYMRPGDAVIPMVGFEWKNIRLMFTYDATISSLSQYNNSRGAFEFALMRSGFYDEYNEKNRIVPNADLTVQFSVAGAGELAAVGNGNPADMHSFKQPLVNTFRGKCLIILRPTGSAGDITLKAESKGLNPSTIVINAK